LIKWRKKNTILSKYYGGKIPSYWKSPKIQENIVERSNIDCIYIIKFNFIYQCQLQTHAVDKLLDPVSITNDMLSIECVILHCCFSSIKYLAGPIHYIIYCTLKIILGWTSRNKITERLKCTICQYVHKWIANYNIIVIIVLLRT
jgi:hypothetical protein